MYLIVGLSFALSGLLSPSGFLWFALFTAAAGVSSSVFNASFVSVVQTRIESGVLGRVMSLYRSFGLLPAALGLLGTGFLAEHVGLTHTFVIAGGIICALGLTASPSRRSCGSTAGHKKTAALFRAAGVFASEYQFFG